MPTTMDRASAAAQVASIEDIVDEIIWHLHAGCNRCWGYRRRIKICSRENDHFRDLLACILVCKKWANLGIAQLWGHYASERNLLSILAGIPHSDQYYRDHLDAEDEWGNPLEPPRIDLSRLDRWHFYTKYIKRFEIRGRLESQKTDLPYFLLKIVTLIEQKPLLPLLNTLELTGSWLKGGYAVPILVALLSPTVQHLAIDFEDIPRGIQARDVIETIYKRTPNIHNLTLTLGFQCYKEEIHRTLCTLIPKMTLLQELRLSSEYMTLELLLLVAKSLPELRILDFKKDAVIRPLTRRLVTVTHPSVSDVHTASESHFPYLEDCHFHIEGDCCNLDRIIQGVFGHDHRLKRISIELSGELLSNPIDYQECASRFCTAIAQTFPAMQAFHLDYGLRGTQIPWTETLMDFLRCGDLTDLSLSGINLVNHAELIQLLNTFPNLTKLKLISWSLMSVYCEFKYLDYPDGVLENIPHQEIAGLQLESLSMIREQLPRLETLDISLVASPTAGLSYPPFPFESLKTLRLDSSFLNYQLPGFNLLEAAQFVSSFLPPNCHFKLPEDITIRNELMPSREVQDFDNDEPEFIQPLVIFVDKYYKFCEHLEGLVEVAVGSRSNESTRLDIRMDAASESMVMDP